MADSSHILFGRRCTISKHVLDGVADHVVNHKTSDLLSGTVAEYDIMPRVTIIYHDHVAGTTCPPCCPAPRLTMRLRISEKTRLAKCASKVLVLAWIKKTSRASTGL